MGSGRRSFAGRVPSRAAPDPAPDAAPADAAFGAKKPTPKQPGPSKPGFAGIVTARFAAAKLTWTPPKKPHSKARSALNELYVGKRTEVTDDKVPWSVEWGLYLPMTFTAPIVLANSSDLDTGGKWADPEDPAPLRAVLDERITYCVASNRSLPMSAGIVFDEHGVPLNPNGRTGLRGRGLLGKWGPNHAADPIVTRFEPLTGSLQVLCILRNDTSEWALPGGMVQAGDSVSATVRKSIESCGQGLRNDTSTLFGVATGTGRSDKDTFDKLVEELFSSGRPVWMGYSDDPRNTDNAWMESKVMHFHCSDTLGGLLPLKAATGQGQKAGAVVWLDADADEEPRYASLYGSHTQWVEHATKHLREEKHRSIDIYGMKNEAAIFRDTEKGLGKISVAQAQSLRRRCVRNPDAEASEIETFPFWSAPYKSISKFGCSVANVLHLRLHVEGPLLMLLMLLVSSYSLAENVSRNMARNDCRGQLRDDYEAVVGFNSTSDCGMVAMPMSRQNKPKMPFYMMTGLGTCQEYSNGTATPAFFNRASGNEDATVDLWVEVFDAPFCEGVWFDGSRVVSYWLEVVNFALVLIFVKWWRRVILKTAEELDQTYLTAADYTVMITGLAVDEDPDGNDGQPGLETRLRADLAKLGFVEADIDHIELGRECHREAACLRNLAALRVERQELQARRKQHHARKLERAQSLGVVNAGLQPTLSRGCTNMTRFSKGKAPPQDGDSQRLSRDSNSGSPPNRSPIKKRSRVQRLKESLHITSHHNFMHAINKRHRASSDASNKGAAVKRDRRFELLRALFSLRLRMQRRREQQLEEKVRKYERRLTELLQEHHRSTGHAFVVFKLEEKRNQLLQRFYHPSWLEVAIARMTMRDPPKPGNGTLPTSAAKSRRSSRYAMRGERLPVVTMTIAAEPSEVYWENLEVPNWRKLQVRRFNRLLMMLVLVGSGTLLTVVSTWKAAVGTIEKDDGSTDLFQGLALAAFAAWLSVFTNFLITHLTSLLAFLEKHDTRTLYERAIFSKLAPAFVLNTAVAPIIVGCIEAIRTRNTYVDELSDNLCGEHCSQPNRYDGDRDALSENGLVFQWWFEAGGIIQHAAITLFASMATDVLHVVSPLTLLRRRVLAPLATSQHKLNKLFRPPEMNVGRLYAYTLRTLSMAIIYAPLNPVMLPTAALMLCVTFWSTRFSVAYWYEKPPAMSEALMERLRKYLFFVLLVQLVLKRLAYGDPDAVTPFYVSCVMYVVAIISEFITNGVMPRTRADDLDCLDTGGVRYDMTGSILERYVCPKARRGACVTAAMKLHLERSTSRLIVCRASRSESKLPCKNSGESIVYMAKATASSATSLGSTVNGHCLTKPPSVRNFFQNGGSQRISCAAPNGVTLEKTHSRLKGAQFWQNAVATELLPSPLQRTLVRSDTCSVRNFYADPLSPPKGEKTAIASSTSDVAALQETSAPPARRHRHHHHRHHDQDNHDRQRHRRRASSAPPGTAEGGSHHHHRRRTHTSERNTTGGRTVTDASSSTQHHHRNRSHGSDVEHHRRKRSPERDRSPGNDVEHHRRKRSPERVRGA